jgi:hypothetical protein
VTALRLLPPLGWTAIVAWLSMPTWSGERTEAFLLPFLAWLFPSAGADLLAAWHGLARKAAHVVEYAVLAGLWHWALRPGGATGALLGAIGLTAGTAVLDELHQAARSVRGGSALDVALDLMGAGGALAALHLGPRAAADRLAAGLLWVAAAGGALLFALDLYLGVGSPWLGPSAALAWIALGLRRRFGRRG